ncbi:MAG: MobP3 family relaxase [Oscillospiraceae bacterium]|nr:MobP3 family relaxase [Oscillospiraceae bacterium]
MPRLIFISPYLKGGGGNAPHLSYLVKYIATRPGAVPAPNESGKLPATTKQKELVANLARDFPLTKRRFEYEDYMANPTRENASDYIQIALEQNLDQLGKRENYVDYIATRPGAVRSGEHGLFSGGSDKLVIAHVQSEVANHPGNVWTPIVSLRREDASAMGYEDAESWKTLLSSYASDFAKGYKIKPENLRWYASFHNESHHPHAHMIIYSADPSEGFLTKKGIEQIKSGLVARIFPEQLHELYAAQTQRRDALMADARATMRELTERMENGVLRNERIEKLMAHLADRLQYLSGKKQYGYLPAKLKNVVDEITDELAKDERIAEAYRLWCELRNEVTASYHNTPDAPLPLSQQKEFKQIRNAVVAEAVKLMGREFTFEEAPQTEALFPAEDAESASPGGDEPREQEDAAQPERNAAAPLVEWSRRYKQARKYLYGADDTPRDFAKAYALFLSEAERGNALAMHDLGRMLADGLGVDADAELSHGWYAKALAAFHAAEQAEPWDYIEYRIGKLCAAGLGTEQDYAAAARWFSMAAPENQYAAYSLGGLYYHGRGVEQSFERALELYRQSADKGFPYAAFSLAKMLRDGIGTAPDAVESEKYFCMAFEGFRVLEKKNHDDKLQYRLGWMLLNGVGTEKDIPAALEYFEESAKLGNPFASYQLAKYILADESSAPIRVREAVGYLRHAADCGNPFAQYALGKLYIEGNRIPKNIPEALRLLTLAAGQGNDLAMYRLGKLYLSGEDVPKDAVAALKWMTAAAEKNNQYAQYALGKLYLTGEGVPKDKEAAVRWFTLSAAQGNVYAMFFLEHMDSFRDPSLFMSATRLLHHMSRVFSDTPPAPRTGPGVKLDRKLLRKLREKKMAQGHKRDDHEQEMTM